MDKVKPEKLIGSKPRLNPEYAHHKWRVIARRKDIQLTRIDIENGCYEKEEAYNQIYVPSFCGTHPRIKLWKQVGSLLKQLLP